MVFRAVPGVLPSLNPPLVRVVNVRLQGPPRAALLVSCNGRHRSRCYGRTTEVIVQGRPHRPVLNILPFGSIVVLLFQFSDDRTHHLINLIHRSPRGGLAESALRHGQWQSKKSVGMAQQTAWKNFFNIVLPFPVLYDSGERLFLKFGRDTRLLTILGHRQLLRLVKSNDDCVNPSDWIRGADMATGAVGNECGSTR